MKKHNNNKKAQKSKELFTPTTSEKISLDSYFSIGSAKQICTSEKKIQSWSGRSPFPFENTNFHLKKRFLNVREFHPMDALSPVNLRPSL